MNKKQAQTEAENLLYTSVAEAKSSLECARSNGRPYSREVLQIVLDRAGHRCELCHARDRTVIFRDDSGRWYNFRLNPCAKPIRIILTLHHINHDITDNRLINLIALCQRCHLRLDRPWKTRRFLN